MSRVGRLTPGWLSPPAVKVTTVERATICSPVLSAPSELTAASYEAPREERSEAQFQESDYLRSFKPLICFIVLLLKKFVNGADGKLTHCTLTTLSPTHTLSTSASTTAAAVTTKPPPPPPPPTPPPRSPPPPTPPPPPPTSPTTTTTAPSTLTLTRLRSP
ncbi:hypothetical protein SprV_0602102200 [Sparganum proliferum]